LPKQNTNVVPVKSVNLLKHVILSAFLILTTPLFSQVQTFVWQGIERQYLISIPVEHQETMPILFFLHGMGADITQLDKENHFQAIADNDHWAIVVPQALFEGQGTRWNVGFRNSKIDDTGFLMALLDTLAMQYPIDLDSVFFTGLSMGGSMTHRMAIEHGDRITACAPVSGLITHDIASRTPIVPVRILHIHGTNDTIVGYNGTSQAFGDTLGIGVDSILCYWKKANACVDAPVIDTFPDRKNDGLLFVRYTYEGDATLQHIKVIGGTHTWYKSEDEYDISYLTEIHKFFMSNEPIMVQFWPDIISDKITTCALKESVLKVVNIQGRIVATHLVKPGTQQFDLGNLPQGLYFIQDETTGTVKKMLVK